jgi:hypothetical protein
LEARIRRQWRDGARPEQPNSERRRGSGGKWLPVIVFLFVGIIAHAPYFEEERPVWLLGGGPCYASAFHRHG